MKNLYARFVLWVIGPALSPERQQQSTSTFAGTSFSGGATRNQPQ